MYRTKRLIAVLLLALLCLTACSSGLPKSKQSAADSNALRIASWGSDGMMDGLIKAYQSKNPGVTFEKVKLSSGSYAELTSLIREEKIDLLPAFSAVGLIERDPTLLQPLDPYLQKDQFDVAPLGRLEDLQYKGRLYELPITLSPFVLLYNQDIVTKAGVNIPDQPLTWDQFRTTARSLTGGQGSDKVWGYHSNVIAYPLEIFIRENATDPQWWNDARAVREGYKMFAEMIWNDRSSPPAPPLDEYGRPQSAPDVGFYAGKAGMTIEQLYSLSQLTQGPFKVGATLLPVPDGMAPMGIARPQTMAIAGTSRDPEAAWRFLRFVDSPDGAAVIAQTGVMPAYRTPATMDFWLQRQPAPPAALRPLATMPLKLLRDADPTVPNHANELVRIQALDAFMGKRSWESAFAEYQIQVPTVK